MGTNLSISTPQVRGRPRQRPSRVGPFDLNRVSQGDCRELTGELPDASIDILVTSPPYWGQRTGSGNGNERDPRRYVESIVNIFDVIRPKMKDDGVLWINIGDAYNTPVNWRLDDRAYSTLGADRNGLADDNSAYVKPRAKRKAFIDQSTPWLQYGNLLALPYRLITSLCDLGYLFRGEVIWHKKNPMPEGRCRRPHRQHESIFLLSVSERHSFRVTPPVGTVWQFSNEKVDGRAHYSRFPTELPKRCIEAYGTTGHEVVVLDPFSGSGTTGLAAIECGCSYIGFEIDAEQVIASNLRLAETQAINAQLKISASPE
jgi:DNA modification methylase